MKRIEILRIVIAAVGLISLITVMALSISGVNSSFSNEMIVTMKVIGGIGIAALLVQTVLSVVIILNK